MPIFPWQRTWYINLWRMVGETYPRGYFFGSLWLSGTILRQIQAPRKVSRERAKSCLCIVCRTNEEQKYQQCWQLTHFTVQLHGGVPHHFSGSHVSYVSIADMRKVWECR